MAEEEKDDTVESSDAETTSEETPEAAEQAPAPEEAALEPEVPTEPEEALSPKERRRRALATKAAGTPARSQRSPEERQAEREQHRRRKAQRRRAGRLRGREKLRARTRDTAATPPREHAPGKPKTRQGVVVSDRAEKTITVRIDVTRRHPRYEKIVRTSSTLRAHDESGDAHIGDTVVVRESRPLSRSKRWRLVEVVERAQ